jgi:hypothetical protein
LFLISCLGFEDDEADELDAEDAEDPEDPDELFCFFFGPISD